MHVEHPITENHIPFFMGQHVCAVQHDGTYQYGVVTGCKRGKLILNVNSASEQEKAQSGIKKKGKRKNVRTSIKPRRTPKTNAVQEIELTSIALLFAPIP